MTRGPAGTGRPVTTASASTTQGASTTEGAAPRRPVVADANRDRLARVLYLAVGSAAVIFGSLSLQPFLDQVRESSTGLLWTAWVLVFGLPIVSALLSRWIGLQVLRCLAIAHGSVFLMILLCWLVVCSQALPQEAGIPWVLTFTGVPCLALAVAERGWISWAFLVLACTLSGCVRAVTTPDARPILVGVEDGLYSLLLISVLVGFTLALRRSAERVEEATRLSRAADARSAARAARTVERQVINALVHDSVISTLLVAGLGNADPAVVSRQATVTLSKLDALSGPDQIEAVPRSRVWLRLVELTKELAPNAVLRSELHLERNIPLRAGDAVVGAVGEALRNSMASAGIGHRRPVVRRVTVRPAGGGIQVLVTDDGAGFDPALVPAGRLGIAHSIVGRMQGVPGGTGVVRSRPGHGTEVLITWLPPVPISGVPLVATNRESAAEALINAELDTAADARLAALPLGDRAHPLSLSGSLGLSTPLARGVLMLFIAVHALLAFADPGPIGGGPAESLLAVLALLAVSAAAFWIILPAVDPFPTIRTAGILLLCSLTAGLMYHQISPLDARPFAHWHLGAVTLVLVVLVARGRILWVWVGYAVLAATTVAWAHVNGLTVGDGVNLVIRHAGTLLAGTLFAVGLRRSGRTLRVLIRSRGERAALEATSGAVFEEREVQLARVNALARPALERLAQPHELGAQERADCLLVEGSLRDAIRARSLFVEPIISATRAARARGVEVTLLDDSGDHQPTDVTVFARLVADELDALRFGRFTARVLPANRTELATIVVESSEHRMLLVAADGTVRDA